MTTLQKTLIGTMLVAAVGAGVYKARRASIFEQQLQTLREQLATDGQDDALRRQIEDANGRLAALQAQNEMLSRDAADVLRLRGEIARLRESTAPAQANLTASEAQSWLARVGRIKARLQQTPGAGIPEFQFLTERDWLTAAKGNLDTDDDYNRALSGLRDIAERAFIDSSLTPALNQFAQASHGQFPTNLAQLQPYFNPPVDDSILQRWQVAPHSAVPSIGVGDSVITPIAPVDADYDSRYAVGPNGNMGSAGPQDWEAIPPSTILKPVYQAYLAANNGLPPTDPSQLTPYTTTPDEQAALQKVVKRASKAAGR